MNTATSRFAPIASALGLGASALMFAASAALADDYSSAAKSVSCSSDDGHRNECRADLRGYRVQDVDQSSRTDCVIGRNWGYDDQGVWVDEGCRATFKFDLVRGEDHPRSYSYRDPGSNGEELRVKCESRDGHRANCNADLRGYRIADVREISKADCDIGRNFGYDDRGVWVDEGCRGEFIFTSGRRDHDDRYSDRGDDHYDRR